MTPASAEYAALASLARTQRVLAGQHRIRAREAMAAGNDAEFTRHAAEARRLFADARWHLDRARMAVRHITTNTTDRIAA